MATCPCGRPQKLNPQQARNTEELKERQVRNTEELKERQERAGPATIAEFTYQKENTNEGLPARLCGPSELRMSRVRKEMFVVNGIASSTIGEYKASVGAVIAELRHHIVSKIVSRSARLSTQQGKYDVVAVIMSFLVDSASGLHLRLTTCAGSLRKDRFSSKSKLVDLFFKVLPKVCHSRHDSLKLETMLEDAWEEDADICLKLIFHLGAARKGKQDRWNFYDAMLWLWDKSPATALHNLQHVEPVVYWKALLEILARVCEGRQLATERDNVMHQAYLFQRKKLLARDVAAPPPEIDAPGWRWVWDSCTRVACGEWVTVPPKDAKDWVVQPVENGQSSGSKKRNSNCGWKPRTRLQQAENAVRMYDKDPLYRALHLKVAFLFADALAKDEIAMQAGKRVSLASKWAPLLDKSFDRRTLVAETIARMLYPPTCIEFGDLTEQHYSYRARLKYVKLLNLLKEYRKEPMRLINARRWSEIKYKAVPGKCMRQCTHIFFKRDRERFRKFLDSLRKKKNAKLNVGSLQPHELVRTAMAGKEIFAKEVAELQWKKLVADVQKHCKLKSCIAVCDMSESMVGIVGKEAASLSTSLRKKGQGLLEVLGNRYRCLDVAVALSLVLSEVAAEPYQHKVVTFAQDVAVVNLGSAAGSLGSRCARLTYEHAQLMKRSLVRHVGRVFVGQGQAPLTCVDYRSERPVFSNGDFEVAYDHAKVEWKVTSHSDNVVLWAVKSSAFTPPGGVWPAVVVGKNRGRRVEINHVTNRPGLKRSKLYQVFESLLQLAEIPEKVFVFSCMDFKDAVNVGGRCPGRIRDEHGDKLSVFQAAERLYQEQGKVLPQVIFWNLTGRAGVPVVATQPGAVLVSGFSPALVKDILAGGDVDPLSLITNVVSEPIFASVFVPGLGDSAKVVRESLALEGTSVRAPLDEAIAKFRFPAGDEWEIVEIAPEVEAEAVEAAAPKRAPLLAVRGVRRLHETANAHAAEDALLALIGRHGINVREARDILSYAVQRRLKIKARVWIDVEHVEGRLAVIAATVSARLPELILREELCSLLLPALDGLLSRVIREPAEAEKRKLAWEAWDWQAGMPKCSRKAPTVNCFGEIPYHHRVQLWGNADGTLIEGGMLNEQGRYCFLPVEEVAVALASQLDQSERVAIVEAAAERRFWPEFGAAKIWCDPPPRTETSAEKAAREDAYLKKKMLRMAEEARCAELHVKNPWSPSTKDYKAKEQVEQKLKVRSNQMPRGGKHGAPALNSRAWKKFFSPSALNRNCFVRRFHQHRVTCSSAAMKRMEEDSGKRSRSTGAAMRHGSGPEVDDGRSTNFRVTRSESPTNRRVYDGVGERIERIFGAVSAARNRDPKQLETTIPDVVLDRSSQRTAKARRRQSDRAYFRDAKYILLNRADSLKS